LHPETVGLIIAPPEVLPVIVLILYSTHPSITYK
jgi:hypothetical protein